MKPILNCCPRLARLQRECDLSIVPALLLLAGCAVIVLMLALSAPRDETASAQNIEPATQSLPPAA